MKSVVSGVAGAVRVNQLTLAGLTRQELHGKRLDATGEARAINDEPPVTTNGVELNALFRQHVEGAFIPRAGSKAMHVIIQFPKDLVDGGDAHGMLHHAREFGKKVFGDDAIFADRVDRDEKSQHVVDLFVAPKYVKKTKRDEKVAVSMTRHLKALAEKHGHPPIPHGIGRALQDAWFEYLRGEMGLEKVQRGSAKLIAGPDWKSAEQLRVEELDRQTSAAMKDRLVALEIGYEDGLAEGEEERAERERTLDERARQLDSREADQIAERGRLAAMEIEAQRQSDEIRKAASADAETILDAARLKSKELRAAAHREGMVMGLAQAEAIIFSEKEEVAALKLAAATDRIAATEVLKAANAERAAARSEGLIAAERELSARQAALDHREGELARREHQVRAAEARVCALKTGIEAWGAGDILEAFRNEDGHRRLRWRDGATKQRLRPSILAAWDDVWKAIVALSARAAQRAITVEMEVRSKAREVADAAISAASLFLKQYEAATELERVSLQKTPRSEVVTIFLRDHIVESNIVAASEDVASDFLLRAAAAGLIKGVQAHSAERP